MGCVLPTPGYLAALRLITAREGTLLIFDEVMTGFRVAFEALPSCITSSPTSPRWARSLVAAYRSALMAVLRSSWTWSPRLVRCTRQER